MTEEENSEVSYATLRATVTDFQRMIDKASLDGDTEHGDLYLNILVDRVEVLQAAPGDVVLTYCTFGADYFDEIQLERDLTKQTTTGGPSDEYQFQVGAEAILDVNQTETTLDFADNGGVVELEFTGQEDGRLASFVRANGALEAWTNLPGSQHTLEEVPHWLPERFNRDDIYTNPSGDEAPTKIDTNVGKIHTIIDAVEESNGDFYPIVVEDGDFKIDVGERQQAGVRGTLGGQSVEGPDIDNAYYSGFEEIVNVFSGTVQLQTAPGNNPVAVVEKGASGEVIRHVTGEVSR